MRGVGGVSIVGGVGDHVIVFGKTRDPCGRLKRQQSWCFCFLDSEKETVAYISDRNLQEKVG